jgi:hypothetical protein
VLDEVLFEAINTIGSNPELSQRLWSGSEMSQSMPPAVALLLNMRTYYRSTDERKLSYLLDNSRYFEASHRSDKVFVYLDFALMWTRASSTIASAQKKCL